VFESRVPRNIFGPKRDKITGEWRRIRNEEFCRLYSSPNIIHTINSRRMRWSGACITYWIQERCIQGFGGEI
jgi:hypothetical protein